jgi:hypothetical protein
LELSHHAALTLGERLSRSHPKGVVASFLLMFILAFVAAAASVPEYSLQTGDLLFVQPPLDATLPLDSAILATGAATIAWLRSQGVPVASNETVVHVALVYRDTQSDRVTLVEATPPVVTQTPARSFFESWTNASTFFLGRLKDPDVRAHGAEAVGAALQQLGKPYADDFGTPPQEFYCSSLVTWAYGKATGKDVNVFVDQPFTLIFEPLEFWEQYYSAMNMTLPLNVTGSNPTLLLHSPRVEFSRLGYT